MPQTSNIPFGIRHNLSNFSHPPPLIQNPQQLSQLHRHSQPQLPPSHLTHAPNYTISHLPQHPPHLEQHSQLPLPNNVVENLEPAKTFLINAHKMGIRAMDTITLSLRNAEDHRTYVKYSKVQI